MRSPSALNCISGRNFRAISSKSRISTSKVLTYFNILCWLRTGKLEIFLCNNIMSLQLFLTCQNDGKCQKMYENIKKWTKNFLEMSLQKKSIYFDHCLPYGSDFLSFCNRIHWYIPWFIPEFTKAFMSPKTNTPMHTYYIDKNDKSTTSRPLNLSEEANCNVLKILGGYLGSAKTRTRPKPKKNLLKCCPIKC